MATVDDQLLELLDKQALYENLILYARGADRHDRELMLSTYWEDSWDDHGGYVGDGPGWVDAAMDWEDQVFTCNHHVSNVLSEIDGHRAKRESMVLCVVTFKDSGLTLYQGARFRDLCEKRDGTWKILHRTCIWDWIDVRPSNNDWEIVAVPSKSHWGAWREEDPIYKDWSASQTTEFQR